MIQRNYTLKIANRSIAHLQMIMLNFTIYRAYGAWKEVKLITIATGIRYNVAACVITMSRPRLHGHRNVRRSSLHRVRRYAEARREIVRND